MSQRSGQIQKPIEVGWGSDHDANNLDVPWEEKLNDILELHAIVRRRWGKRTWRCISTSTVQTMSSKMCNSVIHVELTMNPLRGHGFADHRPIMIEFTVHRFINYTLTLEPMPVYYSASEMFYQFHKMCQPFYVMNIRVNSVLQSVSHPMSMLNKILKPICGIWIK